MHHRSMGGKEDTDGQRGTGSAALTVTAAHEQHGHPLSLPRAADLAMSLLQPGPCRTEQGPALTSLLNDM